MKRPFLSRFVHESGFVMPTVIMLMSIMTIVAYAALLQSNNSLNLAYKQAYIQMARVASKAAVDFAQEQFDSTTCGNYTGTAEQDLVSNARYRVTFKAEVISTSADGYEKVVKGTGSVYLPKLASTAIYVFDIRSEIVRTFALCKTPDNFGPTVWLDASDTATLRKTSNPTVNDSSTVGLGFFDLFLPNDTVEEKATNGAQGVFSWLSGDIEMHTCDTWEFAGACSGSQANRDLYNGIVFQNIDVPQGATVTSATLQLSGAVPSGAGPAITQRVYGLFESGSNPHLSLFQPFGVNQVRSRITSPTLRTSAFLDHTLNNFPPGNTVNYNVTAIVQEMVNNPNWNPANNNGRLGLGIMRMSGTGSKKACKGNPGLLSFESCEGDGPHLSVSYTTGASVTQANNGEGVNEWQDKSGNGNHARNAYGTLPTRVDNAINSLTAVRFNNGNMVSALTSALINKREMTVFAVVKPDFTTSANDARLISGMSATGTNDTSGSNGIIPLFRHNNAAGGFSSQYSGNGNTNRTDYNCGSACEDNPYLFVSHFAIDAASNTITSILKGNGTPVATKTGISPSGSPYTFSIDQFYYGGRRNGTMASGTGTDYLNGDFAELVIYDKILECRQIEALEEYFRSKWNLSASQWSTTCPAETIPTL